MESIIQKNLAQKIKQLPESFMEELSDYVDFLIYKSKTNVEEKMTNEEFQNWIKNPENQIGMSLEEFELKWKNKENQILNRIS